jgi:enoyl-CoA hydratase/carnithine racemase
MSELLQNIREGRLLRLTLNRPDKRNALNIDLCRAIVEAIETASRDRGIGAILFTANGPAFCAGMDLAELAADADSRVMNALQEQIFTLGSRIEKPLIAAVDGPALGGGTGLVANFHIVVASEKATFGLTEIKLGLWPFLVFRGVSTAIGERRTIELALTGRVFPAAEARELGLIHEIASDPVARAQEIATAIAEASPTAIQSGLSFVHQSRGLASEKAGDLARIVREDVFGTEDFNEGIRAFLEKRRPMWPSLGNLEPNP